MFFKTLKYFNFKEASWLFWGSLADRFMMAVPKFIFETRNFLEMLKAHGYEVTGNRNQFVVTEKSGVVFLLRRGTSDLMVFKQIILDKEFKNVVNLIQQQGIKIDKIIDAGANIGLTTLYFKQYFQDAEVLCIEPDRKNYEQLHENLNINKVNHVEVLEAGVWSYSGWLEMDFSFRDGKEWARRLKPLGNEKGSIPVFTISELLEKKQWDSIDLLKLDVEGAEEVIFSQVENLDFLQRTRVVTIEVHNLYQVGHKVIAALQSYDFKIYLSGELVVGVNDQK